MYTIFYRSGHINISGIRTFESIKEAILNLNFHFVLNVSLDNIVVDNSTASGKFKKFDKSIINRITSSSLASAFNISIRPHYFPSIIIRERSSFHSQSTHKKRLKKIVSFATCILFTNGKFIIVGGKSECMIRETFHQLCALISTH